MQWGCYYYLSLLKIPKILVFFRWNCKDECKYECMWKTVEAFQQRGWKPVQFFGKWPFYRFLGMQEPASVIFSALNFLVHYMMLQEFRKSVRKTAPLYKMWISFSAICLNAWFWSIVFHTRDFPITELFDYVFAYSMVLASFYCMIIRWNKIFQNGFWFMNFYNLRVCALFSFLTPSFPEWFTQNPRNLLGKSQNNFAQRNTN